MHDIGGREVGVGRLTRTWWGIHQFRYLILTTNNLFNILTFNVCLYCYQSTVLLYPQKLVATTYICVEGFYRLENGEDFGDEYRNYVDEISIIVSLSDMESSICCYGGG